MADLSAKQIEDLKGIVMKWINSALTVGGIPDGTVTNAMLADMAQATIKGRASGAGTGVPVNLTASQVLTIIKAVDGTGSGLDADYLDGLSSASTASANSIMSRDANADTAFHDAVTHNLIPEANELYDLGTVAKRYRTARVAELAATLFSKEQIILIGDSLWVTKNQGTLPSDVASGDTTIDFGQSMTTDDWVVIRAEESTGGLPALEWILVGSVVSGTTYNVTRNVDGSGANAWAGGTPYAVVGQDGDYRVVISAGSGRGIELIRQNSTWNDTTTTSLLDTTGQQYIGDDSIDDASMVRFLDASLNEYFRLGISNALSEGILTPASGKSTLLGIGGASGARGLRIDGSGNIVVVSGGIYSDPFLFFGSSAAANGLLLDNTYETTNANILVRNVTNGVTTIDTPVNHYDPVGPFLSAPNCRGLWKPDFGYNGTSSTQEVIDISGQARHLSINGTVSSAYVSSGNFPNVPYASIATGTNYLERTDEAALAMLSYFTVMLWVYFADANYSTASQAIACQGPVASVTSNSQWGLWNWSGYASGQHRIVFYVVNSTTRTDSTTPTNYLSSNTWYFAAGRFTTSTEVSTFVGGSAFGLEKVSRTSSIPAAMNNSTAALRLFRDSAGAAYMAGGRIGLCGLYNAALSDATIASVFQSTRDYYGV